MTAVEDELRDVQAEVAALTSELAAHRQLGIALGIVAERLKISDEDAERMLRALAASDGRPLADITAELVRTKRLAH